MRLLQLIAAFLLAGACSTCAGALMTVKDETGQIVGWNLSSQVEGKTLMATLDPKEIEQTAEWDPHGPLSPPVTTTEASHLAWVEARIYLSNPDSWELTSIDLYRIRGKKWAYIVTWRPIGDDNDDVLKIPILLSGHPVTLAQVDVESDTNEGEESEEPAF